MRRAHGRNAGSFSCGTLTYNSSEQSFTLGGQHLDLTPREHAMLRILLQHAGHPMSKQQIVDRMFSYDADIQLEAIEVIAHRLRKKLVGVSELHRLGFRVPEDVSVIGYGDFAAATQISPMLTTLRLPGGDMGVAAFRLLLERMQTEKRQLPPRRLMLVPQIIERESVASLVEPTGKR